MGTLVEQQEWKEGREEVAEEILAPWTRVASVERKGLLACWLASS